MTQPLIPVLGVLQPAQGCAAGRHTGRPDEATRTSAGVWWRCRCGSAWHVLSTGRMTRLRRTR